MKRSFQFLAPEGSKSALLMHVHVALLLSVHMTQNTHNFMQVFAYNYATNILTLSLSCAKVNHLTGV